MKLWSILLGAVAIVAVSVGTTPASAASRHHSYRHHHHHHGYGAFAQYRGHRPTGPSNPQFEMGSGWNNGSPGHKQYGRPDHN
jgi:hypothetical protein